MVIEDEVFKIDLILFDLYCNMGYLDPEAKQVEEQRVLDEVKKIVANCALAAVYSEEVRREAEAILGQIPAEETSMSFCRCSNCEGEC